MYCIPYSNNKKFYLFIKMLKRIVLMTIYNIDICSNILIF